jgi:mannan endo-1,4-beta-mannosidase
MQKTPVIGQVLVVLSLVACGGDDSSQPVVPEFAGTPPLVAAPEAPPAEAESPSVDDDPLDDDAAGSGGVTEGMGLEPPLAPPAAEPAPPAAEPAPMETPEPAPMEPVDPIAEAGGVPRPAGNLSTGFFVFDGRLYDRLGSDFVMRGINHPVAWFQNNALEWMDEIATTGANSVRIVWETTAGSPQVLAASIERAIELGMVPIVELHDETGSNDVDGPARLAQYYVDDLTEVLETYEPYLLVNIANEWGDYFSTAESWLDAYRRAIGVFRGAGLNHTLVIDANDYGQRGQTIVQNGRQLLDFDPQHNVLFSTHMYQAYENPQTIRDVMRGARDARLPLIVGEFGFQHGDRGDGQPIPVPFEIMLQEAASSQIGYLAWSWTGNSDYVGYLDLSVSGSATQLTDWGNSIINGENGIRSTSQPASTFAAP